MPGVMRPAWLFYKAQSSMNKLFSLTLFVALLFVAVAPVSAAPFSAGIDVVSEGVQVSGSGGNAAAWHVETTLSGEGSGQIIATADVTGDCEGYGGTLTMFCMRSNV
jgi:hypothetical protein